MKRIPLRSWRVSKANPVGSICWFDPSREQLQLYELEPETESRVADALEEDDQISMYDELDPVKPILVPEDGLPF